VLKLCSPTAESCACTTFWLLADLCCPPIGALLCHTQVLQIGIFSNIRPQKKTAGMRTEASGKICERDPKIFRVKWASRDDSRRRLNEESMSSEQAPSRASRPRISRAAGKYRSYLPRLYVRQARSRNFRVAFSCSR